MLGLGWSELGRMKPDFLEERRILFLETKYVSGQPSVTERKWLFMLQSSCDNRRELEEPVTQPQV